MTFLKITQVFKWFIELFRPQDFRDKPYYWLLNQFGHIGLGLLFAWLISPLFALIFFVVWELVQYVISKDWKDGLEDLTFELLGVLAFVTFTRVTVVLIVSVLIIRLFIKFYKI
jgi:hypothetical protein